MKLEKIKSLVELIEHSSFTEFAIKDGDFEISMSKKQTTVFEVPSTVVSAPIEATQDTSEEDENEFITSPIVGIFYSAPAPDVPSFVNVGDVVKVGQTVCIMEAMKLMNEIECDFDCIIEAILVSNEQKVGYGQPLFRVKKLHS